MTTDQVDAFLRTELTCRVATTARDGAPHVTPMWFVWDGVALWLNSLVESQRWTNLSRDPRIAVVVDAGEAYSELRGVQLTGSVEVVGEVPHRGHATAQVAQAERLMAGKYLAGHLVPPDGRHAWLRLRPGKIASWDFRQASVLATGSQRPPCPGDHCGDRRPTPPA